MAKPLAPGWGGPRFLFTLAPQRRDEHVTPNGDALLQDKGSQELFRSLAVKFYGLPIAAPRFQPTKEANYGTAVRGFLHDRPSRYGSHHVMAVNVVPEPIDARWLLIRSAEGNSKSLFVAD
jgi:hypothetical protein